MSSLQMFQFNSASLAETRMITVYLPPAYRTGARYPVIFCADGQAVPEFSRRLNEAIERESVPSVILIGVHSSDQYRAKEYIDGADEERFQAHERFFTDEIYRWAFAKFNPCASRESCAIFGFSNGAAFALSMGVRHREKYGVVIAFSTAGGADRVAASEYSSRPIARHYLSAGTREKPFNKTTANIAKLLTKHGVDNLRTERCAGHELEFWASELPLAIRWSFPLAEVGWFTRVRDSLRGWTRTK